MIDWADCGKVHGFSSARCIGTSSRAIHDEEIKFTSFGDNLPDTALASDAFYDGMFIQKKACFSGKDDILKGDRKSPIPSNAFYRSAQDHNTFFPWGHTLITPRVAIGGPDGNPRSRMKNDDETECPVTG